MMTCQENLLKSAVSEIDRYASEHPDALSFYRDIGQLEGLSLQALSLENDLEFLGRVASVLNAVTAVIARPHIVNASENVVVRAEQAHALTPDMFADTIRDARLWRDKDGEMTPEEVHYTENVDELDNYENRFIVRLIDALSERLANFSAFYAFAVRTLGGNGILTEDHSRLEEAYDRLGALDKKLRIIKNTRFYRTVSKSAIALRRVEATNVLKHNPSYCYCYKFYTAHLVYGDGGGTEKDLAVYFYTRVLVALRSLGYVLDGAFAHRRPSEPLSFVSPDFAVTVEDASPFGGLYLGIKNQHIGESAFNPAEHLLVFDGSVEFDGVSRRLAEYKKSRALSVDAVSVWNAAYVDGEVTPVNLGAVAENELISRFITENTRLLRASRSIYGRHCPVCGSREVEGGQLSVCMRCGTKYAFAAEKLWIVSNRRK